MPRERVLIEGWPVLLPLAMAARYLSLEEDAFRIFVDRHGVPPVEPAAGELLWRGSELDGLVKRLPSVPFVGHRQARTELSDDAIARIARAVARHLTEQPASDPRALLSIKDAIGRLGLGRSTLYKMIDEGRLQPRRIGRRTLIPRSQIDALLEGKQPSAEE